MNNFTTRSLMVPVSLDDDPYTHCHPSPDECKSTTLHCHPSPDECKTPTVQCHPSPEECPAPTHGCHPSPDVSGCRPTPCRIPDEDEKTDDPAENMLKSLLGEINELTGSTLMPS